MGASDGMGKDMGDGVREGRAMGDGMCGMGEGMGDGVPG